MTQQRGEPDQMATIVRRLRAVSMDLGMNGLSGNTILPSRFIREVADLIETQSAAVRDLAEALEEWASWYESVRQDFAGFTDDARDADRLHDWTFIDGYRPAPELTALHTHAATVAAARRK